MIQLWLCKLDCFKQSSLNAATIDFFSDRQPLIHNPDLCLEFNAAQARRVNESGQSAIETKKDPFEIAVQKESGIGLLNVKSF